MDARACLLALLILGCGGGEVDEAGVGGSREGCEEPGTHSVKVGAHSCACEAGYTWCDERLDAFDCCPSAAETETGEPAQPDLPCDEELAEQLICEAPAGLDDPSSSVIWACNGMRWVEVPGYAAFECMAQGFSFAYGCIAEPAFLCGYGPGSPCEVEGYPGICVNEDIIDTCVWGRRTVDRCARMCAELGAFGAGFSSGACVQPSPEAPAVCVCS